jgi:ATP-dependent DNA helicase RecG
VTQRAALAQSGAHLLVMTATPIPRSLALTVYGDLDLSVIDETPPGRQPIESRVVAEDKLPAVYAEVVRRAGRGERSFLVFPLIEESEGSDLASAEGAYAELAEGPLCELRLALLHGRLPSREKDEVCRSFERGELDVLVSTTVIEVGIDVPEATVMVIHHAERFGLAQLHQLRGRVGRGSAQSLCVLVTGESVTQPTLQRLRAVAATEDGFEIAELDLEQRGMGDLHGVRQHGELPFRLLNPLQDEGLVRASRTLADAILQGDPQLEKAENEALTLWLDEMGQRSTLWSAAG